MKKALSVEEGRDTILQRVKKTETETVAIADACGRVLAATLYSPENIPPFDRAPLDGYTFRHEDTIGADEDHPVTLKVIEEIPAGKAPEKKVGPGEASHIMTGGPIPEGADVVEKFEVLEVKGDTVTIFKEYKEGDNVVRAGEDIRKDDVVLKEGTIISPAYQGILAGLGFAKVTVYKKPVVTLISTGSELVPADEELTPGKIRNSSIYTLKGFLESQGMIVKMAPIVDDDDVLIAEAVKKAAAESDMVMTTGGVSVGDDDMVMRAMERLDADILFWKLVMKPGMAFLASVYDDIPVIGLSGNPSSAVISMLMAVLPVLRFMAGREEYLFKTCRIHLKEGFKKRGRMRRYLPGKLVVEDGLAYLSINSTQKNGILHHLHECNAIAFVPETAPTLEPGAMVDAFLL